MTIIRSCRAVDYYPAPGSLRSKNSFWPMGVLRYCSNCGNKTPPPPHREQASPGGDLKILLPSMHLIYTAVLCVCKSLPRPAPVSNLRIISTCMVDNHLSLQPQNTQNDTESNPRSIDQQQVLALWILQSNQALRKSRLLTPSSVFELWHMSGQRKPHYNDPSGSHSSLSQN